MISKLNSVHPKMKIFAQDQGMHNHNHRHIFDIPRIIFSRNDEIGQKRLFPVKH